MLKSYKKIIIEYFYIYWTVDKRNKKIEYLNLLWENINTKMLIKIFISTLVSWVYWKNCQEIWF